jgi:hypothetical protein
MRTSSVAVVLGVAAAMTGLSSHADSQRKQARGSDRTDAGMQAIAHGATKGQPGYRWRYFVDAREGTAVVISPNGDYFYSDGAGLTLVHKGTGGPQSG